MPGYDSLESLSKPRFFLHASQARLHLLRYRRTDSFRKATLFRLTGEQRAASPFKRDLATEVSQKIKNLWPQNSYKVRTKYYFVATK